MYKSSSDQHYEPMYRSLSKEHSREVKKNHKLEDELEQKAKEIAELKEQLKKEKDANKKLRALLFKRNQPKTRTQREQPKVSRSASSYRRSPAKPTEHKTLALECCPNCSSPVTSPISKRERVTTDIVINPDPTVTAWTINRYYCSGCHKQVEPTLPGVLPKAQLGPGVLTVVVIARYRWNLPYAKIIDHLKLCQATIFTDTLSLPFSGVAAIRLAA